MRLVGAAAGIRRLIASPAPSGWQEALASLVLEPARAAAGARADDAWAEGAAMSVDQAIECALGGRAY
jgi:hypothetical protein